jgi:uncharacterized repeat protein (TIGR04052 family)
MKGTTTTAVLFAAAGALAACDDHSHDEPHTHGKPIEIRFAAMVGAEAFACDKTFADVGGATLEPLDFRLYVHDLRLVDSSGKEWTVTLRQDGLWQSANVALLDFEDKRGTCENGTAPMNTVVKGTYDTGHDEVDFTGLRFRVGVPFALNHGDASAAESPLNLSGMFWSWQAGYKFLRLDMRVVGRTGAPGPHGESAGINIHLGSTGCSLQAGTQAVASCSGPNRPEFALAGFDMARDTVVIDYAALVAGIDLAQDPYPSPALGDASPGCMASKDDPECALVFSHLGLDLQSGMPTGAQTVFSLR